MRTSFVRRPFTGTRPTAKQHTQNTSYSFTSPHKENFRQRTTSTQVVFTEEHTRVTRMDTYRRCFANDNQFNGGTSVRLTNSIEQWCCVNFGRHWLLSDASPKSILVLWLSCWDQRGWSCPQDDTKSRRQLVHVRLFDWVVVTTCMQKTNWAFPLLISHSKVECNCLT